MNLNNLSAIQLRRAANIKDEIERLKRKLASILGERGKSGPRAKKKRMSPATRAKLRAKLRAYWAAKRAGRK